MALIDNIYKYFERDATLRVLFIFDPMQGILSELQGVQWNDGYRFVEFADNWFSTKYALENEWRNDKVIILFKMQSPSNTETRQLFPLMDILVANAEFKSESDEAFMQQHNIANTHRELVRRHIAELQLDKFNKILAPYYGESFSSDIAYRGLISAYMGESKMLLWNEIIARLFVLDHHGEETKSKRVFATLFQHADVLGALQSKLTAIFGAKMEVNSPKKMVEIAQRLKYNLITQLMAVENADNYKHLKIANAVIIEQMNQFFEAVSAMPTKMAEQWKSAFETLSADIRESEIVKVYSLNAQYFYVPVSLCWEIMQAILLEQMQADSQLALEKIRTLMMKQRDNEEVYAVLQYAFEVASFYNKKRSLGSLVLNTPDEYVNKYTSDYYLLDMHYRKSLEYFMNLPFDVPVLTAVEEVKAQLDRDYANITNQINIEWVKCLKERGDGFGEITAAYRQEEFYKVEKRPTKVAVIVCDALRYEVAKELIEELHRTKHTATLDAAVAMLPTETKYCKPALLPHEEMTLYNDTLGIDHTILDTLEKRDAHLKRYVDKGVCISFDTVQGNNQEKNRKLFYSPLVYVFHDTIDNAGHDGTRGSVVNACAQSIKELAKMVNSIHSSYNVKDVIITADHGFLYNDMTFAENDKTQIVEQNVEQKSRYYITDSDAPVTNVVKFPMRNVSGIDSDLFVTVPIGTNRFKVQGADYNFVHGGAALQEVIIPVIHSSQERTNEKTKVEVSLLSRNLSIVSSRLKVQLFQNEAVSAENKERNIVCAIYCNDAKVSNDYELALNSTDADNLQNRMYEFHLTLNQAVTSGILQLRVYDTEDMLNPLIKETVTNNTLIDQDF